MHINLLIVQDICYMPLYPDVRACTIQSVIEYFQNNETRLDMFVLNKWQDKIDYLNHIVSCLE